MKNTLHSKGLSALWVVSKCADGGNYFWLMNDF